MEDKTKRIVFGGGCFWCTEAVFDLFEGVIRTTSGYAGGNTKNPTYEDICNGDTGHAEVLQIEYEPEKISLEKLLDIFFTMHDPTSLNRQGADTGTQYRSVVLYTNNDQKMIIEEFIKKTRKEYDKPIVTQVEKLTEFFPSEEYHQKYYKRNSGQPYCSIVIGSKIQKVKKKYGLK
ncbi:peptide-methionine (S)-S-oxide reductase MsrA [Candidatus Micrarchaeota archaeon]|nr:peptide-methionine (S)-S-oxide reductase MsrA [Candidatus Micrarchaeota archaeon]